MIPDGAHRRIVLVVVGLASLLVVAATVDFAAGSLGLALAIPVLAAAAAVSLWILATHLDNAAPASPISHACLRLLVPFFVFSGFASWAMNLAIFEQTTLGGFVAVPAAAAMPGAAFLLTRLSPTRRPTPDASTAVNSQADNASLTVESGRTWTHSVTSLLIAIAWLPLGFLVWFAANWCSPHVEDTKVLVLSSLFVGAQLLGNLVAGPLLDRRFGREGGRWLCVGRSAVSGLAILAIASGLWFGLDALIGPHGPTPDGCA